VALVEAYAKEQKLWHDADNEPVFSEYLELDLGTVVPSIAGPKRPQDRILLSEAKRSSRRTSSTTPRVRLDRRPRLRSFPASDPGSVPARRSPTPTHLQRAPAAASKPSRSRRRRELSSTTAP
jgi:aconitate hydratase